MADNYIGKTCPYCQFSIKSESDIAVCSACSIPHHQECWQENGGCTTFGCVGELYREERTTASGFTRQFVENADFLSLQHLPVGTLLQDKYMIGRALGQSGYGITYVALDMNIDLKVVIKEYYPRELMMRMPGELKPTLNSKKFKKEFEDGITLFLKEAKKLIPVSEHRHIVTFRDYFKANQTAYQVMSCIEGSNLEAYLNRKEGKISFTEALELFVPLLDALQELHQVGIMHWALNPQNILVDNRGKAVITGFGVNWQKMRQQKVNVNILPISGYSPPEQYLAQTVQGQWSDIYSVAALIYCSLSGQAPPEAIKRLAADSLVPPSKTGVLIDRGPEEALIKALAVKAEDRYQTVEEFQKDLFTAPGSPVELSAGMVNVLATKVLELEPQGIGLMLKELSETCVSGCQTAAKNICSVAGIKTYMLDYQSGTIPLADLAIGSRILDLTWQWEYRTGNNYTGTGNKKAITWIVVAKNHYDVFEPHVTLLAADIIGKYGFDKTASWASPKLLGRNHWGESGIDNAIYGLRPWLNSNNFQSGEGFYRILSESFKSAVLTTILPNREWENGNVYSTEDRVYVPSSTELGDFENDYSYRIGKVYSYFLRVSNAERIAKSEETANWYWTRSPDSNYGSYVRVVHSEGDFDYYSASEDNGGVRPALNLKSEFLVSEVRY